MQPIEEDDGPLKKTDVAYSILTSFYPEVIFFRCSETGLKLKCIQPWSSFAPQLRRYIPFVHGGMKESDVQCTETFG